MIDYMIIIYFTCLDPVTLMYLVTLYYCSLVYIISNCDMIIAVIDNGYQLITQ